MLLAQSRVSAKMGRESGWWQQQRLSVKLDKESLDYSTAPGRIGKAAEQLESHPPHQRSEAENNRKEWSREWGSGSRPQERCPKTEVFASFSHGSKFFSNMQNSRWQKSGQSPGLVTPLKMSLVSASSTQVSNMSANRQLNHLNPFLLNASTSQKQRHEHIFLHCLPGRCRKRHYSSLQKLKLKLQQEAAPSKWSWQ